MKKTIDIYHCDYCQKQTDSADIVTFQNLPIIFTTEQEEGRSTDPYVTSIKMDLCKTCIPKIIVLRGQGAHGHNIYSISKENIS